MKFTQFAKSLSEGIRPVYLFEGEEIYFRDHAVFELRKACALSQPALNDVRFEGETLKGDELFAFRDGLYALPFLDERRIVRAYEFYPTEREWAGAMKAYAEAPCPSTVLAIVNGGRKAGSFDLKKAKGVTYVDCSRADEETLTKWLFTLMRRQGLNPDSDACALMVRRCALDAARLKKETEKLRLLLGEGGAVTRAVVEEHVERDAEYKVYELTQAASRGDFAAFSEILQDLSVKGFDEYAALSALTSHFKTLTEIASSEGSNERIGGLLGLKPYAVKKNRELVSALGKARVEALYEQLYALGCGARSGLLTKQGALFSGVAQIFFGRNEENLSKRLCKIP